MVLLLSGAAILLIDVFTFWYCLPRGGKTHRFVGTELEPYVAVAICVAVPISLIMILSGIFAVMEGR